MDDRKQPEANEAGFVGGYVPDRPRVPSLAYLAEVTRAHRIANEGQVPQILLSPDTFELFVKSLAGLPVVFEEAVDENLGEGIRFLSSDIGPVFPDDQVDEGAVEVVGER